MSCVLLSWPDFLETDAQKKDYFKSADFWEPISEIEVTDEIAKLRPMMIHMTGNKQIRKLYGVKDGLFIMDGFRVNPETYQLATVEDL